MRYTVQIRSDAPAPLYSLGADFIGTSKSGHVLSSNNYFLTLDGKPFFAVSGEFHFSRGDARRWEDEIIKMRMGGINVVSTYLFWNHIEEAEGVFDFSGSRDVRRFVQLCGKHGLYVILRVGPFDHGEVRNGGLPDWLYGKPFEVRHTNEGFLHYVRILYQKIGEQVRGLFFKDDGPIIAVQLDNEYMHSSAPWEMTTGIANEWVYGGSEGNRYMLALRDIALTSGLTPAFFTATAWGGAVCPPQVMPLWGGYAYRPWIFYSHRGEHPATEEYVYEDYHHDGVICADDFAPSYLPQDRPYACCEMGAGMMCCYYYRFIYPYKSVDALANIKLASGCNFLGYYMFHGGTNPIGKHGQYLNESQVPKRSYDYQAALGEFGQIRESYSRLKGIHFFTQQFADRIAPMETVLPTGASAIDPTDLDTLRFAVRTDGTSGFLFINNFQDHRTMPAKQHEEVRIETVQAAYCFDISIASEENAILPFHFDMDGILLLQATAQPILRTVYKGKTLWVFLRPDGMDGLFCFEKDASIAEQANESGDVRLLSVRKDNAAADVLVLSRAMCNQLFVLRDGSLVWTDAALLEDERGALRLETACTHLTLRCWPNDRLASASRLARCDNDVLGIYTLDLPDVQIPVDVKETAPHRFLLRLPEYLPDNLHDVRLRVDYEGDIGHLFLDNVLIHDNFCNGDTWEFGLMEYKGALQSSPLVLMISPLRKGAKVQVETAMAARTETVTQEIAVLHRVCTQPVWQIAL